MVQTTARRLTRSTRERVFGGVCGGFAEYLGLDPVLVRVLYIALTVLTSGFGIILYLAAWIIVPMDGGEKNPRRTASGRVRRSTGMLLLILGGLGLFAYIMPWSHHYSSIQIVGPILVVLAGLFLVVWKRDADANETTYSEDSDKAIEIKRLYRVESQRKIAGICAGIAHYFDIDPTIVRLVWILLIPFYGAVIPLYIILWFVIPLDSESSAPLTSK